MSSDDFPVDPLKIAATIFTIFGREALTLLLERGAVHADSPPEVHDHVRRMLGRPLATDDAEARARQVGGR